MARSARRGGVGLLPGPDVEPVAGTRRPVPAARQGRHLVVRDQGWPRSRPAVHRRASSCSATSPTSVTCAASPSTPRRRPTPSSSPDEQVTAGVTPDLVRLCIGIETLDDILADLEAGFRAAKGARDRRRGPVPRAGAWQPGDEPGAPALRLAVRRPPPRPGGRRPARGHRGRLRDLGRAGARRHATRCSCCTRSPATATPPGPSGPATRRPAGGTRSSAPAGPSTPTASSSCAPTCSAAARARPARPRPPPTARPTGPGSRASPSATRSSSRPRSPTGSGIDRWHARRRRLDGRDAGPRVGRRLPRPGRAGGRHRGRREGHRRADRALLGADPRDPRRPASGEAATTTTRPADRDEGLSLARASGRSATAPRSSSTSASAATTKVTRTRSPAAATRSSRTSSTTATKLVRRFDANSYIVLSEAMNHHDVGRGRGGVAAGARRG